MELLVFTPYLRPAVWGGRDLQGSLGKTLPEDGTWGESWEVSVHPTHVSRVAEGPLTGHLLTDLCQARRQDLFGPAAEGTSFPPERQPVARVEVLQEQGLEGGAPRERPRHHPPGAGERFAKDGREAKPRRSGWTDGGAGLRGWPAGVRKDAEIV
jgi:hypothetical protein